MFITSGSLRVHTCNVIKWYLNNDQLFIPNFFNSMLSIGCICAQWLTDFSSYNLKILVRSYPPEKFG